MGIVRGLEEEEKMALTAWEYEMNDSKITTILKIKIIF